MMTDDRPVVEGHLNGWMRVRNGTTQQNKRTLNAGRGRTKIQQISNRNYSVRVKERGTERGTERERGI